MYFTKVSVYPQLIGERIGFHHGLGYSELMVWVLGGGKRSG